VYFFGVQQAKTQTKKCIKLKRGAFLNLFFSLKIILPSAKFDQSFLFKKKK
jgi:hypothetical protein